MHFIVLLSSTYVKVRGEVGMPVFQLFYEMKLKTCKFNVLAFWSQWRYHDQIQIAWSLYYKDQMHILNAIGSGSGSTPFLIPAHWNITILSYKQAKPWTIMHTIVYIF